MPKNLVTKCAHPLCRCRVETEEPSCCAACAEMKDEPHAECPCGHPECIGDERAVEVEDEELDVLTTGA